MSAQLDDRSQCRRMCAADLDAVMAIENEIYEFPWTRGNFNDSLSAGYDCWVLAYAQHTVGYGVLTVAAGESHLLNLSIAAGWQRLGLGGTLLRHLTRQARANGAEHMYLEVRPSNAAGRALYAAAGFTRIALRPGYYPASTGREDAILLGLHL
jgi:ribosomal-protein-alanine N-acetyltransferase